MKIVLQERIREATRTLIRNDAGQIVSKGELLEAVQQLNVSLRQLKKIQLAETVGFADKEIDDLLSKLG